MEKQTEKKKNTHTQKNTDKRKTTTTTPSNLLLSLNVANLATDNCCYLWRKFDTKKILGRNRNLNHFCLSFQSNTSGLKLVTYQTNRCSQ